MPKKASDQIAATKVARTAAQKPAVTRVTATKAKAAQAAAPKVAAASAKPSEVTAKAVRPRVSAVRHRKPIATVAEPVQLGVEAAPENSREIIAAIAYGYWEARGFQGGNPLEDWLRAEAEFRGLSTTA